MAFEIKIRGTENDVSRVRLAIWSNLQISRFNVTEIKEVRPKRTDAKSGVVGVLTIHQIRLCVSKPYCGSHPNECQVKDHHAKTGNKMKMTVLEGADWVGFNDLVNDTLDALNIDADVGTFVCEIRRGRRRRVRYGSHQTNRVNKEWDEFGPPEDYQDYCGRSTPTTEYPEGTPGEPQWRNESNVSEPSPLPAGSVS